MGGAHPFLHTPGLCDATDALDRFDVAVLREAQGQDAIRDPVLFLDFGGLFRGHELHLDHFYCALPAGTHRISIGNAGFRSSGCVFFSQQVSGTIVYCVSRVFPVFWLLDVDPVTVTLTARSMSDVPLHF